MIAFVCDGLSKGYCEEGVTRPAGEFRFHPVGGIVISWPRVL